MRLAGHVARMEDRSGAYGVLVERERDRPVGKIPHGRPRCRREDNITMDC